MRGSFRRAVKAGDKGGLRASFLPIKKRLLQSLQRRRRRGAFVRHSALVVEVAVTSPQADRLMAEIYAEAGVGEYWIVLPNERLIEVYRQPEGGSYRTMRTYARGEALACETVPGLRLSPAELCVALD